MDLEAQLPALIPPAVQWALREAEASYPVSFPVTEQLQKLASLVGVKEPRMIRIRIVEEIPMPQEEPLRSAAIHVGLADGGMRGLTLGYLVFIRKGSELDAALLSHEFRHVAQYEACGGVPQFLSIHLRHLARFGYNDSPFEVDARAHEVHAA